MLLNETDLAYKSKSTIENNGFVQLQFCGEAYNNRGIAKDDLQDLNGACLDLYKAGELGDCSCI